jgi:hypothetical protein
MRIPIALACLVMAGCKDRGVPNDLVGTYTRSGDVPASLRAELSIARGGMVLTVVRLTATADLGSFASLVRTPGGVKGGTQGTVEATVTPGRSVIAARAFQSTKCETSSCKFELAAEEGLPACGGSFERTNDALVVVGLGPCAPYSGRWVAVDTKTPPSGGAPASSAAPTGSAKLDFPPDVPQPHDHMSCLQSCSIVDIRCHRTATPARESFLKCVEEHETCRARCEQVYPFFGR